MGADFSKFQELRGPSREKTPTENRTSVFNFLLHDNPPPSIVAFVAVGKGAAFFLATALWLFGYLTGLGLTMAGGDLALALAFFAWLRTQALRGKSAEPRICIDVADLDKALTFYTSILPIKPGRRFDKRWRELIVGPVAIDLLAEEPGSLPFAGAVAGRDYARHWTPVHLDFAVQDLELAVARAQVAGARLEGGIRAQPWGRIANLADPFGNGFCFLEFRGRGYDEIPGVTFSS